QMLPLDVLPQADCVLIDGHQMAISEILAAQAQQRNIPVVIDGGSWKPGFDQVLPLATAVVASANFSPPGAGTEHQAIAYLRSLQIPQVAVTRGERPILYCTAAQSGELTVSQIRPVDTLGAGDIFHGAFCAAYGSSAAFLPALGKAAEVATLACQSFGTRRWIEQVASVRM
ncbi:MAG: PfkB family carbohydrate kinase, partial [Cyanobacteria bacterium P01_H01_bin.153]